MDIRASLQPKRKGLSMQLNSSLQLGLRKKIPIILQTETTECGVACLAMCAAYFGHQIDLASLRNRFSASLRGTTLQDLTRIAGFLSLSSRPIKLELAELNKLRCPAILHWDMNHFVVLTQVHGDHITIHDPARGRRVVSIQKVSCHFTGVALELVPDEDFKPRRDKRTISLRHLVGRLQGWSGALTKIMVLAFSLEIFGLASPLFMQWVVDSAIVSADKDLLTVLAAGFLLLAFIQVGMGALRSWLLMALSAQFNTQLVAKLFGHLLQLPIGFFAKRHLGDVVSRFESLTQIQRTLTGSFIEALIDGVMTIAILIMMLIYSPLLTLIVCIAALCYGALRFILYRPLRQAEEEQIVRGAKQQSYLLESVRAVQSIKLLNGQPQRHSQYQNLAVDHINSTVRVQRLAIMFKAFNGSLFGIENIAVVWLGARLVLDGGFSVGMLFAFIAYKQIFITRIVSVIEKSVEMTMLGLHAERVADIAQTDPENLAPGTDLAAAPPQRFDIEICNLDFRYSATDPYTLRNVNMRIEQGESVAIIGPSGCGKTTLLKIILGLLPPDAGEVRIGGIDIRRLDTGQYRSLVGTVMQDDHLLTGSIADNICFFTEQPDHEQIIRCAELAAVHDDILAMPMGYHTMIGDMGSVLSGGQKQRLLLARALYKRPHILVLDEATSHLDIAREKHVSDAIRNLHFTRIIVAHRPETIASVDRIIDLSAPEINPPKAYPVCSAA